MGTPTQCSIWARGYQCGVPIIIFTVELCSSLESSWFEVLAFLQAARTYFCLCISKHPTHCFSSDGKGCWDTSAYKEMRTATLRTPENTGVKKAKQQGPDGPIGEPYNTMCDKKERSMKGRLIWRIKVKNSSLGPTGCILTPILCYMSPSVQL